jgi:hypothetical protein
MHLKKPLGYALGYFAEILIEKSYATEAKHE